MIILIDGYNVLKQRGNSLTITQSQRGAFARQLAQYARQKKHTIITVFDGGPYERPAYFTREGVTFIYSGLHENADGVIQSLITHYPASSLVIVSSDREIRKYAAQHNVQSIDALEFDNFLRNVIVQGPVVRVIKSKEKPQKVKGYESEPELDKLMEQASSIIMYKDEDTASSDFDQHKQKLSKKEKKKLKVIKKL
jgi:predicted RNA-binding protein with PIN domain